MPDNERVTWAVQAATGLERVRIPYSVLKKCRMSFGNPIFRHSVSSGLRQMTCFLYDMLPMEAKAVVGGLVVDIGTTTVSALIVDMLSGEILAKASSGNGQIRYGADVINRIIESQKPGGHERLQNAIIKETLNPMISNMCRAAKNQQSADLPCGDCRKHYHGASDDGHQCRSASDGAVYSCLL